MILLRSVAFLLASLSAVPTYARLTCAATKPPAKLKEDEARFASLRSHSRRVGKRQFSPVDIPVHWHVVSENATIAGGNVPDQSILDSIAILNVNYASTGFQFTLVDGTRNLNPQWFIGAGPETPEELEMMTALKVGGLNHLNVYTVALGGTRLGYARFPDLIEETPELDGVVMLHSTVVGGSMTGYNLGGTLTHEVGHWLGLFHTFEGGCTAPGDYVDDTPPEIDDEDDTCGIKDTCPMAAGMDLVDNWMSYSIDSCYTHFTPGQVARMQDQWTLFRSPN